MGDAYKDARSQIDAFRIEAINSHSALEKKYIDTRDALRELPEDDFNVFEQSKLNLTESLSRTIDALDAFMKFLKEKKACFQTLQCGALKDLLREHRGRQRPERETRVSGLRFGVSGLRFGDSGLGSIASSLITGNCLSQSSQVQVNLQSPPCQYYSGQNQRPIEHEYLNDDSARPGQQHGDSTYLDGLVTKSNIEDSKSKEDNIEKVERWQQNCLSPSEPNIRRNTVDISVQTAYYAKTFATQTCDFDVVTDASVVSYPSICQDFTNLQHKCERNNAAEIHINAQDTITELASNHERIIVPNEDHTHQNLEIKLKGTHKNYDDNIKENKNVFISEGKFSEQGALKTTKECKYKDCTQGILVRKVLNEETGYDGVLTEDSDDNQDNIKKDKNKESDR